MKANEVALTNFLSQNETQFIIPVYQRNYDWTEAQCFSHRICAVGMDFRG